MKTRFYLKAITDNIPYRPEGYYEEVVSSGKIVDNYVELEMEQAVRLVEKYREKNPAENKLNDKEKWGPILWGELHQRTNNFDGNEQDEKRWLQIFNSWIPCGECKAHWKKLITDNPADLSSKENYVNWAIKMHNIVNKKLNKKQYEQAS